LSGKQKNGNGTGKKKWVVPLRWKKREKTENFKKEGASTQKKRTPTKRKRRRGRTWKGRQFALA